MTAESTRSIEPTGGVAASSGVEPVRAQASISDLAARTCLASTNGLAATNGLDTANGAVSAGGFPSRRRGAWPARILGLAILIALSGVAVAAFQFSQVLLDSAIFQTFGYVGIFLLTVTCSATLFLPAPAFGAVGIAGSVLNPFLVGLAAGLGAATGELTGYAAGRSGRVVLGLEAAPMTRRIRGWMLRYGFFALLALSAIPNPLFDAAGLTAGSLGYPVQRYWVAVALGKTLNYSVIALVGYALANSWP